MSIRTYNFLCSIQIHNYTRTCIFTCGKELYDTYVYILSGFDMYYLNLFSFKKNVISRIMMINVSFKIIFQHFSPLIHALGYYNMKITMWIWIVMFCLLRYFIFERTTPQSIMNIYPSYTLKPFQYGSIKSKIWFSFYNQILQQTNEILETVHDYSVSTNQILQVNFEKWS